jgi:hypothetical protein
MELLQIEQEALQMSPLLRLRLADVLTDSVDGELDHQWRLAVLDELTSREQATADGQLLTEDGDVVVARLRAKYGRTSLPLSA